MAAGRRQGRGSVTHRTRATGRVRAVGRFSRGLRFAAGLGLRSPGRAAGAGAAGRGLTQLRKRGLGDPARRGTAAAWRQPGSPVSPPSQGPRCLLPAPVEQTDRPLRVLVCCALSAAGCRVRHSASLSAPQPAGPVSPAASRPPAPLLLPRVRVLRESDPLNSSLFRSLFYVSAWSWTGRSQFWFDARCAQFRPRGGGSGAARAPRQGGPQASPKPCGAGRLRDPTAPRAPVASAAAHFAGSCRRSVCALRSWPSPSASAQCFAERQLRGVLVPSLSREP